MIVRTGHVFEIVEAIVGTVKILVVDLQRGGPDERFKNQSVHETAGAPPQTYHKVTIGAGGLLENTRDCATKTAHTTKVTGFVDSLPPGKRTPGLAPGVRGHHQKAFPPAAARFSGLWSARCALYCIFSTTAAPRFRPIAPARSWMRISASASSTSTLLR